jgi:hypothetical protein
MSVRALLVPVLVLAACAGGCEDPRKKKIEQIGADQAVLQKVNGAVNAVLRSAADCEAARPLTVEAYARIEEAGPELVVPASQQTLAVLKSQVDRVAQACP